MNKKLFLFDLDGVLIDSKKNMEMSWKSVQKKFHLDINFKEYFQHIGIPFSKILENLRIEKYHKEIAMTFKKESTANLNLIKPYKDVKKILNILKKNNKKIGIVTSKDKIRTYRIIQKLKVKFDTVKCPSSSYRGKPAPDSILISILHNQVDPAETLYFGDMHVDYLTAKRAKIDYVHASYGYEKRKLNTKFKIKNITEIMNFL